MRPVETGASRVWGASDIEALRQLRRLSQLSSTSTPAGRMVIAVLGAAAEFERGLLRERTRAGLASARRRGQKLGRPRAVVNVLEAERLASAGFSRRAIAKQLGVSPATVHRVLTERFKNVASA